MLGYVHHTSKIWRVWDFTGRGRAVESSNVVFVEEENAIRHKGIGFASQAPDLALVFPGESEAEQEPEREDLPLGHVGRGDMSTPQGTNMPEGMDTPKGDSTPQGRTIEPMSQRSM